MGNLDRPVGKVKLEISPSVRRECVYLLLTLLFKIPNDEGQSVPAYYNRREGQHGRFGWLVMEATNCRKESVALKHSSSAFWFLGRMMR